MLKQKLDGEHLIDYIWEIVNNKPAINIPGSIDNLSELFSSCIFMSKEDYEGQSNCTIYNEYGDEFIIIEDIFLNQYSNEDFLQNIELYNQLDKLVKKLNKYEQLIIFK